MYPCTGEIVAYRIHELVNVKRVVERVADFAEEGAFSRGLYASDALFARTDASAQQKRPVQEFVGSGKN